MDAFTTLKAVAVPLDQANIDTDQVIPARFLGRTRDRQVEGFFHDTRLDPNGRPREGVTLNNPAYKGARIIVANYNFACGSSRENAVTVMVDNGFRAFIAPSFGDIFFNNCMKNGIVPVRLEEGVCASLRKSLREKPGAEVTVDLTTEKVSTPIGEFGFQVPPFFRELLLEGVDEIGLTLTMLPQIEAFEKSYAAATPWLTPLS